VFADWRQRSEAFLERMGQHGLPVRHHLVWPNTPEIEHRPDFQYYEAEWAINHLATCEDRPTALVTISDVQAFAAIRQMNVLGLKCPEDMSVVGFDDGVLSRWAMPKMTSVSHNLRQITQRACEVLLGHIERWYVGQAWEPVQEQIAGALTIRESTARVGRS
jgi:LacI family transcriptional regulator